MRLCAHVSGQVRLQQTLSNPVNEAQRSNDSNLTLSRLTYSVNETAPHDSHRLSAKTDQFARQRQSESSPCCCLLIATVGQMGPIGISEAKTTATTLHQFRSGAI